MDQDLRSIQQAREMLRGARRAQTEFCHATQESVDAVVAEMAKAGAAAAARLAKLAHEETGFGRVDSKTQKNIFATSMLVERMRDMNTCGVIRRLEGNTIWEIATPMGVVAALVPSTNPTSTAMYKAIIAAKARCAIVLSPHPRAAKCTAEALRVVAEAAYNAGAPRGLFNCLSDVTLAGTNELLENDETDVILATGGTPMVRAAYSKGKPAYGVGSGNVPVYVDRSADIGKAAADIVYGASFDWGTLCSTERSVVVDNPVRAKLIDHMKEQGAYFLAPGETHLLREFVAPRGRLNVDQVGMPPAWIAEQAGFEVPDGTRALVAEVSEVGKLEPLSMETLSPILSFYTEDGWERGCDRCIQILKFGGIGHTLGLHCTNQSVIEAFALEKPAMRIVVNTVAALGSVGFTTSLFPAMTLGPGTVGGSITSDNISPLHLLNVKRMAFETSPVPRAARKPAQKPSKKPGQELMIESEREPARDAANVPAREPDEWQRTQRLGSPQPASPTSNADAAARTGTSSPQADRTSSWIDEIEARLRDRAGNAPTARVRAVAAADLAAVDRGEAISDDRIEELIARYSK